MAHGSHSGARVARTRNLEIPQCAIAHLRSGPSDHPGMTIKCAREMPGIRLNYTNRAEQGLPLTFGGSPLWFAQPLGSLSGHMRNKITKLLILVVPRRTAGGG